MGQNLCGQVETENICGTDDNLLWSYVTAKDEKYISIDLLFDEESCLNFKKRHKLFKKFKRMMRECDDYVLVRILEFDMDKSFKKEITKSVEHLDFDDIFTGDGNTDSRQKIVSDYNSDADVELESDDHNTTMKTTCFDKPEPNTFIPIHEIPALSKSFIDLHEQPLEISRQKTIEDLSKLESGSIKKVSNERLDSGFEEEQEEQYSQDASALKKLNIYQNLLSEIHELPDSHVVSGYVSVDNFICDSSKNIELEHGIPQFRGKIKILSSKQLFPESKDSKYTSDCCCHGQHKIVETDKRSHTRRYVDVDCCRTAPRNTRQENNISKQVKIDLHEYYQSVLKSFVERHNLHVKTRKSFSFSDYIKIFDDYFLEDYSLSKLDKQGKEDVFKLLILGLDLVSYDRQYHVLPINGLQKYFEQMSVPVSSRPAHVETMRYEWVRVRSYWSFPSNIRVSPIAMARVGFYYTGKCTECKCFSCGKVYKEWQDGDDPYVIHQQISPNCPYMNGQENENVPIHEEDRLQPRHHIDQTLVPSTAPVNPARVAAEAAAVRIPGLSSTEISRIPVSGSAGQGTPLGTSQSGDFSFRFPSTQSGSSTQSAVVNQASSSYFARPQQPNQNVGQSSVPTSSSQGVTNPTVGKENSSASKNSGTPPQSQQPSNTQQNISSLSTSQREETTLGIGNTGTATQTQFSEGTAATRSVPASSPATVAQSLVGTQKPTSVTTQSQSTANTTSSSQSQTPPAITNTTSTSSSTGGSSRTGASGSSNTGASGSSSTGASGSSKTTVGSQPTRTKFDPLGINFEKPRYPTYAVLTVRINTYNGWPTYLDQTPRAMAMAGFFYAGYGDYTRCFFCGGGLRNWEAGDDPWVEHARWFPKCAFLRQNRGDNFVAKVQERHHEVESVNQPILSPQLSVLDDERPANIMSSVPVQTLREMGKDDSIINEAIDRWKANRRRTGQSIASVEMQATELYEIILQIEDERTQGASAQPSTGQQLSLSTNQAPTQTTDDTNEQPTVAEGTSQELPAYLEGFDLVLKEYEEQKERLTCRICTENPVAVAFLPCGHLVCCLDCAPAMRKCPICHELVKGTIKTFFP